MIREAEVTVPWPGPIPYSELERSTFFGRERERSDIIEKLIAAERLSILTGGSAAGKSSLLRAGIAPVLWDRWIQSISSEGRHDVGFPLILREWGTSLATKFNLLLQSVVLRSLESTQKYFVNIGRPELVDERIERVRGWLTPTQPSSMGIVKGLVDNLQTPVILLFDQFEEVLRNRDRTIAADAVHFLAEMYQFRKDVRVLVSLRREHADDLHTLESVVGPLGSHRYDLDPMSGDEATHVALQSATAWKHPKYRISEEFARELSELSQESGDVDLGHGRGQSVDMLTFQCLLREVALKASAASPDANEVELSHDTLRALSKGQPEHFAQTALIRWIDESISRPSKALRRNPESRPLSDLRPVLEGLVARNVRMVAPFLSSGGFKTTSDVVSLYSKAFEDDLAKIVREPKERWHSGLAYRMDGEETRFAHRAAFDETLHRLSDANVLKVYGDGACELVHDRLSGPLEDWSRLRKANSYTEARSSLVALTGKDIVVDENAAQQSLRNMVWRGCWIYNPDFVEKALFDRTVFQDCDLRGSIFDRCTFRGAVFDSCLLHGVVFEGCRFEPGPDSEPTVFRDLESEGQIFRGSRFQSKGTPHFQVTEMGNVSFIDCRLRQPLFQDTHLRGPVQFLRERGTSRVSAAVFERVTAREAGHKFEFAPETEMTYSSWDEESARVVLKDPPNVPDDWPNCGPLRIHELRRQL